MKIGDVFLVVGISIVVGVLSAYVMIASGVVVPEAVSSTQSAAGSFEGDSQEVNAQGITINVDWEDIENVPTDLADGDADTRCDASGVCSQVCIGSDCKTAWTNGDSSSSGSGEDALATLEAMGVYFEEREDGVTQRIQREYGNAIFLDTDVDEKMSQIRLTSLGDYDSATPEGIILMTSAGGTDHASFISLGGSAGGILLFSDTLGNEVSICFVDSNGARDCISSWDELR